MRHQIYTVIFMQGINRTWIEQSHIVVACDKFMGAHKHLPVFGIFNYVHCTLSCGGGQKTCTTVPQAKMVIGNIHHRGMGFGGAHVWKMSHPQAMEFFHTQNLQTCTLELCTQCFPKGGCPKSQFCIIFQYFCPKTTIN